MVSAIAVSCVVAVTVGAREAATVLVATLLAAAVSRLIRRGRRPEGIAVRSTWLDVLILVVLAVGIGLLLLAPGV